MTPVMQGPGRSIMSTSHNGDSYDPSNFDDEMCLKPPGLLWFTVLYLSRGVVLPIGVGIGHVVGLDAHAIAALRGFWRIDELIPALVALPILYALFRRTPKASRGVRWLWAHGRVILALSAGTDIVLSTYSLLPFREFGDQSIAAVCAMVADVYLLIYVLKARRVRDTFADFPLPLHPN
jgi:Protein of unknown function (DUF2919)